MGLKRNNRYLIASGRRPNPDALPDSMAARMAEWQERNPRLGGLNCDALPILIGCDARANSYKKAEKQSTFTTLAYRLEDDGRITLLTPSDRTVTARPSSRGLPSVSNGDNEEKLSRANALRIRIKNEAKGAY